MVTAPRRAGEPTQQIDGLDDPYRKREYIWRRWEALKTERSSWDAHARELARYLQPRSSRFTTSDTNKGGNRHNAIYDNTGLRAIRIFAAGMQSGLTSPARPWFRLKHADEELMAYEPVKVWCAQVTRKMLDVFAGSNIYRALHQGYAELAVFGTHANLILPSPKRMIHATTLTWGEYAIATDADGTVDTLYREFMMTAVNMVRTFGWENCSNAVKTAYNRGSLDTWFNVVHAIEPRLDRQDGKLDQRNMPWRSCYFEQATNDKEVYLRESGFNRFRALCPRWETTGMDVYGQSPGMEALGDSKQLQHEQFRKAQGIDYMTKPPIGLPTNTKGAEIDTLPGGVSYFDIGTQPTGQRQLFDVKLDLNHLLEDIQDVRGRVNAALYVDLFLTITGMDNEGADVTARYVAERHEEKLLMLGPALERLHNEDVDPLVDMTFDQLLAAGMLPPPPPELEGQPLETELLGVLAQAQRAVATGSMDRFLLGVGGAASSLGRPEIADKVNGDQFVELYGDALGVDPRVLNDDETVGKIRQGRAAQQAAAMKEAAVASAAKSAGALGKVPTQGGASNMAVDAVGADPIGMFQGYGSPQAERLPDN